MTNEYDKSRNQWQKESIGGRNPGANPSAMTTEYNNYGPATYSWVIPADEMYVSLLEQAGTNNVVLTPHSRHLRHAQNATTGRLAMP